MERPTLPQNISEVELSELRAALDGAREYVTAQLTADEPDLDFVDEFSAAAETYAERQAEVTATAERVARAQAALAATETAEPEAPEAPAEADDEGDEDEPEPETEEASGEAEAPADEDDAELSDTTATEAAGDQVDRSDESTDDGEAGDLAGTETEESEVDRPNAEDLSGEQEVPETEQAPQVTTSVRIAPGVPGFAESVENPTRMELAKALASKWDSVGGSGTGERFVVAQIKSDYPEIADFSDGNFAGLQDDSIVAACAPLTPYYDINVLSSVRRPVFDSLFKVLAPRGGVSIYASPRFSVDTSTYSEEDGFGQWTTSDDNNPVAVKEDCYDFVCGDTTDFKVYGTYRCMNIRNLDAITFPELVAGHERLLESKWARYAERLLLDAMVAQADENVHASATYGAVRTILSRFDQITAQFREKERLDDDAVIDLWLPRWVRNALREDVIRAWNDSGVPDVVVDSTIAGWFADFGADVTFTFDNPTIAGDLSAQGTGLVNPWPDDTWYLMTPRNNLGVLDLGTIDIGLNPNGQYRDTTLNKRNRFQMFVESFEGIVNRGLPVWRGNVTVLANGAAPAGVTAISDNGTV